MALDIEARRRGGRNRARSFTSNYQRWVRSHLSNEQARRNGYRGGLATIEKYGYPTLFEKARQWRLEHPTAPERAVIGILADLGHTDYEREHVIAECTAVDFAWPADRRAIEVNGKVHYDPLFDDPVFTGRRSQREAERLARLTAAGWQLLVIDYRDLDRDPQEVRRCIAEFVGEVTHGDLPDLRRIDGESNSRTRRDDPAMVY